MPESISLKESSVCIVDAKGKVVREVKVASEPECLVGYFDDLHAKSSPAQDTRALLVGRKLLQGKLLDVELSIRGILRGYGLKVGEVSRGRFETRIQEPIEGHAALSMVIGGMLAARAALWSEFTRLHREMLKIARADKVCQRPMTTPGVGALVALTYRSAVDDPTRFGKSSTVGAYFGFTPKKYQSGETDRDGGVSKVGDAMVRTALFEAAHIMLTRATRFSNLKRWALDSPASRHEACKGRSRPQDWRRPAPYVGGYDRFPLGSCVDSSVKDSD